MTAVPTAADPGADGPEAGYYPDPSIPGYVRYWDGLGWTPGTSRPAPAEGEELPPPRAAARSSAPSLRFVPPPVPQRLLPPIEAELDQSGPIFLDATGPVPEPRIEQYRAALFGPGPEAGPEPEAAPEPAGRPEPEAWSEGGGGSRWVADVAQQRGLLETGLGPRWVSWGSHTGVDEGPQVLKPRSEPEPEPEFVPVPADEPESEPVGAVPTPVPVQAPVPAPVASAPVVGPAPAPVTPAPLPVQAQPRAAAAAEAPARPAPRRVSARPAPTPASAPPPRRVVRTVAPRPALLGRRLAARLFDMAMVGGIVAAVGAQVIQTAVTHIQDKIDAADLLPGETRVWLIDPQTLTALGLLAAALFGVGLLYEALPTALWGRTLGKAVFGLRVLDRRSKQRPGIGASLARWLSYQVMLVLAVGVLDLMWCMVDRPWRQCWHDKIGRTFVVSGRAGASRER